jgi:urease accessory protein UreE
MRYDKGCFIFLFLLMFSLNSGYASDSGIGKIALIEGRVDILRPSGEVILARPLERVQVGDRIRTKSYSKAEIDFWDKSVLRLAPNTCVEITEYKLGSRNKRETGKITLARGKVRALVSGTGPPDTFAILTPNACGTVKGSDIFATYQGSKTSILVKEGSLSLSNPLIPGQLLEVGAGDTAVVSLQKPPAELRPYFDAELRRYEKDVGPTVIPRRAGERREAAGMNGTTVSVNGKARLFKSGSKKWHYLKLNETISAGDTILTEEDGKIEVRLDNGDVIGLQPDTELVFAGVQRDRRTGENINVFESNKGRIKAIIDTG